MTKKIYHAIGLMSGTSLDGVDVVYVRFDQQDKLSYKILQTQTYPYDEQWQQRLSQAYVTDGSSLSKLHTEYGFYLGDLVNRFIEKHRILALDFVASHGHTVFHQPQERYTLQIGHGAAIAERTKHTVVCDFRTQDVIMGGQGAPLVPIGDQLLFSDYDYCLNIGGFANFSYDNDGVRLAKDLCPANILLNHYCRLQGLAYDDGGQLAKTGQLHQELLEKLNGLSLYQGHQSMAYEDLERLFLPLIDTYDLPLHDVLRTLVEHTATIIAQNLKPQSTVLTTGGGAYNTFLVKRLREHSQAEIILPSKELIDYKEALIFALLGLLRLQNKVNILSSVTHVAQDHSSGVIYKPST